MYNMIGEGKIIFVLTNEELDSLNEETYLSITDLYGKEYLIAITHNDKVFQTFSRLCHERNVARMDIRPEHVTGLKDGLMINYSDLSGYPLYLSGEGLIGRFGYKKEDAKPNIQLNTMNRIQ